MWITTDQAIEIYARYCTARYGAKAKRVVAQRAAELGEKGDLEGKRVWDEVEKIVAAVSLN